MLELGSSLPVARIRLAGVVLAYDHPLLEKFYYEDKMNVVLLLKPSVLEIYAFPESLLIYLYGQT